MAHNRSDIAQRILPQKGLFSHRSTPSQRGARERMGLQMASMAVLLTGGLSDVTSIAISVGLFGIFISALWLLGEGLRAEDDYNARPAARAPRLPLKTLAALLMGLAVGLTYATRGGSLFESALAAILAAGLQGLAFGLDPRQDKDDLVSAASADRVDGFAAKVEADLATIRSTLLPLNDPDIDQGVCLVETQALALLDGLALYPAGIATCQRHLTVYLHAICDTAQRFALLQTQRHDPARHSAFIGFLSKVAQSYKEKADSIRLRNNVALDISIDVLQAALATGATRNQ
ncbi:hypothetical protein [Pseudorhodobacter ferrugineus]|uniref:hypothetical protein n=1 Tax=Pseudorhodobacter ferrugineus TaxID=77008 RepID=UPI0004013438|nr:hypothetical protein [Pseudorhodobacter ferrugineus]